VTLELRGCFLGVAHQLLARRREVQAEGAAVARMRVPHDHPRLSSALTMPTILGGRMPVSCTAGAT
jgi:hypothetical protein